jgi:glutaconyl-CoA/methylmalonyl-CoA decarboxylase subunit delta
MSTTLAAIFLMFGNLGADHLIIFVVGYSVVFGSLALLWFVFQNLPHVLNIKLSRFKKSSKITDTAVVEKHQDLTGEETAAISTAIYLFLEELHDEEHTVLTIEKISKRYSPWSSKIYSVTNGLNKRF